MSTVIQLGLLSAWVAGTLGSAHCLGMCGGIASLAGSSPGGARPGRILAFNAGRLGSYSLAGALVGSLGWQLGALTGEALAWGGALRLMMGLMMIAVGLHVAIGWTGLRRLERLGIPLWRRIGPLARRFDPRRSAAQALAFGALWGWIPCGLVYSALLTALVSGSATAGASIMLAFGFGTLPAMLSLGLLGQRLQRALAAVEVRRLFGLTVIGFGVWTATGPLMMARHMDGHPHSTASALAPGGHGGGGIGSDLSHCVESGQIEECHVPTIRSD